MIRLKGEHSATKMTRQQKTKKMSISTDGMVYPPGCKEVRYDMPVDELIRRLKVLASAFQGIHQDDRVSDEYVPVCLHLVEDGFLCHSSKDVKLLIACCIADILRLYAPEAPYVEPEQVKVVFQFLIGQLVGLKDPKDAAFKRYFYLLENLAYVKSFNMCFELDDAQEIFCSLYQLMFSIVNEEHSAKVKSFMLDVLCPLIMEGNTVSDELLHIVFANIIEPLKISKKSGYNLVKELIIKCSEPLEPLIHRFFNRMLMGGEKDSNLIVVPKVYEMIYSLYNICPNILLSIIPQLEYKLKSTDETERLGSVSLLARMFSESGSTLAIMYTPLWQAFLGRFNDISVPIRVKCVQYSMHFLINHPELRIDIVETLKLRQHDVEENVRFEVVKAIVATAKLDFGIVSESEDLLNYVKDRTLDKKFKIRREALQGLALIYRRHLNSEYVPEPTKRAVNWMKDKILHIYYMHSLDDRILVERLMNTCLVPFQLDPYDRMMKLLYLYGTIDTNATKAFVEIQKNLMLVRRHVTDLLNCIRDDDGDADSQRKLNIRISQLTKFLPDPVKASEFLCKFSSDLKHDQNVFHIMEIIVGPSTDCKACAENTNLLLKKLGPPVMTNLYYNTIKLLLERTSSVIVDREAISKLIIIMHQVVAGKKGVLGSLGFDKYTAIDRGLSLIEILAFIFPHHFCDSSSLEMLIQLLNKVGDESQPKILTALTFIGRAKPIGQYYTSLMELLVPQCQHILVSGSPKQAKGAVRCLHANINESARNLVFGQVVEALRANLDPTNSNYRTVIVALGHIAFLMPEEFKHNMKPIVAQKIVRDLLVNTIRKDENYRSTDNWCAEEDLPEITRCMLAGMKTTVRWLMGLKYDLKSAANTFKMLTAFVETGGEFKNNVIPFSNAETAWLRLTAGCCMLKICEQKGVGDQFTASQFCALSKLMNDEVFEVRSQFATKLHRGLARGIPNKCLPLDFMGFYSLAGYENDTKQKKVVKGYMVADVEKRREYIKTLMMTAFERAADQLPHIMPDYMLVFSVPVLTHNPRFTSYLNIRELAEVKECLWFILEPLILRNENYSFGFYKTLVERMKNHKDALDVENQEVQCKMYALCDIALGLIFQRSTNFDMKNYPSEPRIPPMYFKRQDDKFFSNTRNYLPVDLQYSASKKSKGTTVILKQNINPSKRSRNKLPKAVLVDEHGNVSIDAQPNDASKSRLQIDGIRSDDSDNEEIETKAVPSNTKNSNEVDDSTPEEPIPMENVALKSQYIVPDLEVASPKLQSISEELSLDCDCEEEIEASEIPIYNNKSFNEKENDDLYLNEVTVETRNVGADNDEDLTEIQDARVRITRSKAVVSKCKADTPSTATNVRVLKASRKRLSSSSCTESTDQETPPRKSQRFATKK